MTTIKAYVVIRFQICIFDLLNTARQDGEGIKAWL